MSVNGQWYFGLQRVKAFSKHMSQNSEQNTISLYSTVNPETIAAECKQRRKAAKLQR